MMRRILFSLLALVLFAACEKSDPKPQPQSVECSVSDAVLADASGAKTTFSITTDAPWTLSVSGSDFDVTPRKGSSGTTSVTLTASGKNNATSRIPLGTITIKCGSTREEIPVSQKRSTAAPQTVIMYLPWSGNLYSYFQRNIEDAKKAIAENIMGDSRLVVFLQSSAKKGTLSELYYDKGKCKEITLHTYDDINVTQADVLTDLFGYIKQEAPATKYSITIGSHGMAWIPYKGARSAPFAAGERQKWHWEYISPDGEFTRWFGDGSTRSTNVPTFAEGIAAAGINFEYILFDDCFMSSIETVYDLRTISKHIIASPCEVMAYGYPYDLVLPHLFTNNGAGYDLEGVCKAFYNFYKDYRAPLYDCGAIAVTVTSELESMATIMREINNSVPAFIPDPANALQQYEFLYDPTRFYDFGDYVEQLCKSNPTLLAKFHEQLERTVPEKYRLHTEYYYSNGKQKIDTYWGISTSAPSTSPVVLADIEDTAWHKATH